MNGKEHCIFFSLQSALKHSRALLSAFVLAGLFIEPHDLDYALFQNSFKKIFFKK